MRATNSAVPLSLEGGTAKGDSGGPTFIFDSNSGTLEATNSSAVGTGRGTVSGGVFIIDAGVDIGNAITLTGTGSAATVVHDAHVGDHLANTIDVVRVQTCSP